MNFRHILLSATLLLSLLIPAKRLSSQPSTLPNLHINAFAQTSKGVVFIATARGLYSFDGYEYKRLSTDNTPEHNSASYIRSVVIDSNDCIWYSSRDGIYAVQYDTDGESTKIVSYGFNMLCAQDSRHIIAIHDHSMIVIDKTRKCIIDSLAGDAYSTKGIMLDRFGHIWSLHGENQAIIGFDENFRITHTVYLNRPIAYTCHTTLPDGRLLIAAKRSLVIFDPQNQTIDYNPFNGVGIDGQITAMSSVGDGIIHIGTDNNGIYLLDTATNTIKAAVKSADSEQLRCVTTFFTDRDQNLWIGTFDQGYRIKSRFQNQFNNDKRLLELTEGKFITSITEDRFNNLWIGTRNMGLICYNKQSGRTKTFDKQHFAPFAKIGSDFIQAVYCDSQGRLWIANYHSLLRCRTDSSGNLTVEHIFDDTDDIVCITEGTDKRMWCGSDNYGLMIFDDNRMSQIITNKNITRISRCNDGKMLIAVYLQGVYTTDADNIVLQPLTDDPQLAELFRKVIYIAVDNDTYWFGTYDNGMIAYNTSDGSYKHFTTTDGLPSNDVLGIIDDGRGYLWLSTSFGMAQFDKTAMHFQCYYDYDGIGGNQFHEKSAFVDSDGDLYFGGNHGVTQFRPQEIVSDTTEISVILEDLKLFNNSVKGEMKSQLLSTPIEHAEHLTFTHDQNIFSFDYAGINYATPYKTRYAYRLIGQDEGWNYVGDYRRASFSNLKAGHYIFEVKALNNNGYWSNKISRVGITVKPSPWLSPIALIVYAIICALVAWATVAVINKFQNSKRKLWLAKSQYDREKKLSNMKARFFMNISHELRTPLSMIYGPVRLLCDKETPESDKTELLKRINYNTQNLLRLVDQLLDYGRVEGETLELTYDTDDACRIIRNVVDSFAFSAREKHLSLTIDSPYDRMQIYVDADKFGKILNNLVSNAVKYTPQGGEVIVKIETTDSPTADFGTIASPSVIVSVIDNGIGISDADMLTIFERYKRSSESETEATGFGIGLHYAKRLVDMLQGDIVAKHNPGGGSIFSFFIPLNSQQTEVEDDVEDTQATAEETVQSRNAIGDESFNGRVILVVDDNAEIRMLLKMTLQNIYTVVMAEDGEEGFNKAKEIMPDIIVSDILMPKMDGTELCKRLKNTPDTCHIPVVMLTAKNTTEDQIAGYATGANMYINKPFDPQLLRTIIFNLLCEQERIRLSLAKQTSATSNPDTTSRLNAIDAVFVSKLQHYMDENIANTELNIQQLSRELGLSRTNFFRKVKALTGYTPNDFMRIYRLNRAAELLTSNQYSVAEISVLTGFVSASHFSTSFKKHYGVPPKTYTLMHDGTQNGENKDETTETE